MHIKHKHAWQVTPQRAKDIQNRLRQLVSVHDNFGKIDYVAGIDVGFEKNGEITRAAITILEYPSLNLHEVVLGKCKTCFPYVPGLLSFRELPAVLKAFENITTLPGLLLCDGQGLAHPRRFGIACHLGVLTDIPTIGVGKTRLLGTHKPVARQKGAWQPLTDGNECIGAVLRTRTDVKPVYVSIGHRISLETAMYYVLQCCTRFKLPETTRMAHKYASIKVKC